MSKDFDLVKWCDTAREAALGVIDPALLPKQRRRHEQELALLTTPENIIYVVTQIKELLLTLDEAQKQLKVMQQRVSDG